MRDIFEVLIIILVASVWGYVSYSLFASPLITAFGGLILYFTYSGLRGMYESKETDKDKDETIEK